MRRRKSNLGKTEVAGEMWNPAWRWKESMILRVEMCDSVLNFRVNVNIASLYSCSIILAFSNDSWRFIWVLRSRYRLCSIMEHARVNE
jgi:hypothetical protein